MVEGDDRMEQLQDKIARLEKEISELPVGYISKKTINGIVRQYHLIPVRKEQIAENGKKKSKYLDDETAEMMAERISKRRELQKELKQAKALMPKKTGMKHLKSTASDQFKTSVLTGVELRQFTFRSSNMKSRPCLKQIQDFLNDEAVSRVLILYGLRRTGKTTLIQQDLARNNLKRLLSYRFGQEIRLLL